MNIEDIDLGMEFNLDEVSFGVEESPFEETTLPKSYIYIEGLVMMNQIKGLLEEDNEELLTLPLYAEKNGEPKEVGVIEVTSENILAMQLLGLTVTIQQESKDPILFNKVEDYVAFIKTLREVDTDDSDNSSIPDSDARVS